MMSLQLPSKKCDSRAFSGSITVLRLGNAMTDDWKDKVYGWYC
jgi:uncharacterized iron-regulated protein